MKEEGEEKEKRYEMPLKLTLSENSHWAGQQLEPQRDKVKDLALKEQQKRITMQSTLFTGFKSL